MEEQGVAIGFDLLNWMETDAEVTGHRSLDWDGSRSVVVVPCDVFGWSCAIRITERGSMGPETCLASIVELARDYSWLLSCRRTTTCEARKTLCYDMAMFDEKDESQQTTRQDEPYVAPHGPIPIDKNVVDSMYACYLLVQQFNSGLLGPPRNS